MKKVLMTADTVGGVWTYAVDLIAGLEERGYQFALATMGRALSDDQRNDLSLLKNTTLFESEYKLEWMEDCSSDVEQAGRWLKEVEAQFKPDLIHFNNYFHADLGWRSPTLTVCHSCVHSWWQAVKDSPAPEEWSEYRNRVRKGLAASDLVVAPSFAMLAEADRLYGPFSDAAVVPNGRRPLYFLPAKKEPQILCAGRVWDEAKNVSALVQIAEEVSWPILIAGEGELQSPNVQFLGVLPAEELAQCLSSVAIYALPALYEPFGLSVLEAALSGCALVLGDIPSLRENWDDAALFVDPRDKQALKEALQLLTEDHLQREMLADAAVERAKRFSQEAFVDGYDALYQQLLPVNAAKGAMVL